MVVTRSGFTGVGAARPVVEERNVVIVFAPTLRLQTVEKTAADWEEIKNHLNVTHLDAQFMVVTRRGVGGPCVASHVTGELSVANVNAPDPHRQTEDEAAGDLDEQKNGKDATHRSAQVIIFLFLISRRLWKMLLCLD